jgi:hypothetical protein
MASLRHTDVTLSCLACPNPHSPGALNHNGTGSSDDDPALSTWLLKNLKKCAHQQNLVS